MLPARNTASNSHHGGKESGRQDVRASNLNQSHQPRSRKRRTLANFLLRSTAGFIEGLDTRDLKEAKALQYELGVKAEAMIIVLDGCMNSSESIQALPAANALWGHPVKP